MKVIFLLISLFTLTLPLHAQESTPPGLFPIAVKGKHGYIDGSGTIVIRPRFDDAWRFSEGLAPVLVEDKWGYIDQTGKIVIPPQFFQVMPFQEGLAVVGAFFKSGLIKGMVGNYGYIDRAGKFVIAPQYGVAFGFSDGLARIQTEDYKNGFIDKTGKVIFWGQWPAEDFSDGLALFQTHGNMPDSKTGYLDKAGRTAISPKFDWGEGFSEGLACVSRDGKAGFIDTKGKVVIDFRFDGCHSFSEGLAAVMIGDQWGYVDKSGKMTIEPRFAETEPFADDLAVVRVVDGSEAAKKEERYFEGPNIVSIKQGKFGVVDRGGRMILPAEFVQLGNFSGGLAWVNLGRDYLVHGDTDTWGYINKTGRLVWTSFVEENRSVGQDLKITGQTHNLLCRDLNLSTVSLCAGCRLSSTTRRPPITTSRTAVRD